MAATIGPQALGLTHLVRQHYVYVSVLGLMNSHMKVKHKVSAITFSFSSDVILKKTIFNGLCLCASSFKNDRHSSATYNKPLSND